MKEIIRKLERLSEMDAAYWNTRNQAQKLDICHDRIFEDLPKVVRELKALSRPHEDWGELVADTGGEK